VALVGAVVGLTSVNVAAGWSASFEALLFRLVLSATTLAPFVVFWALSNVSRSAFPPLGAGSLMLAVGIPLYVLAQGFSTATRWEA
jgi:hypothetical protein